MPGLGLAFHLDRPRDGTHDPRRIRLIVGVELCAGLIFESLAQVQAQREGRHAHMVRMWGLNLVIRSDRAPGDLTAEVRGLISEIDPLLPVRGVATMTSLVDSAVAAERMASRALTTFGFAALGLAILGLYSVVSFSVSLRAKEIGIRMAVGASRETVVRSVAGAGLGLAALGVVLGLVGSLAASRLPEALLFGMAPAGPENSCRRRSGALHRRCDSRLDPRGAS